MVVFGAGASHDSFAEHPPWPKPFRDFHELGPPYFDLEQRRPPLAAHLFDERFAGLYPEHRELLGLFPQLRRTANSTGIEQRLAELVELSANDSVVRQQMLEMRFYLKAVIAGSAEQWLASTYGSDNYVELLDRIDRWRRKSNQQVALVTFNYDVLLDRAFATLPYLRSGFTSMADYVSCNEYKVLKLHGSTDWLRLIDGLRRTRDDSHSTAIEYAREHQLPVEADIVTATEAASMGDRWADVPAIAIPVQEKSTFEMPATHLEMLTRCIDATTDLIIVGWKGMETHFLNLWHARITPGYPVMGPPHLKRVLIVDRGKGTQLVEEQLRTVALVDPASTSIDSLADGFSAFLGGDRLETFLDGVLMMPDRARV